MFASLIDELMEKVVLVLPVTTSIQATRPQVQNSQPVVVSGSDGYPLGIVTPALWASWPDSAGTFADQLEQLLVPVLTASHTPLMIIVSGIDFAQALPWHVVMENDSVIGVVSPDAMLHALAQWMQAKEKSTWLSATVLEQLNALLSYGTLIMKGLPGNPILPRAAICYRCPGAGQPHRVNQDEVARSLAGNPLCPVHVGTRVVPTNPCGVI